MVLNGSQWLPVVLNGSPCPQSNLNVNTGFAVPTLPGICVLKFKMKFLHVRTLGTMITSYHCQLYTHFVLISCCYCCLISSYAVSLYFHFRSLARSCLDCSCSISALERAFSLVNRLLVGPIPHGACCRGRN